MIKKETVICPACGAEMRPEQRGIRGVLYSCPQCSCRKIAIGVAVT